MSEVKHTPGPWTAFNNQIAIGVGSKDSDVAWVRFDNYGLRDSARSTQEDEANARLIAAAPELLEACRLIVCAFDALPPSSPARAWTIHINSARSAIAKATGGQP